MKKYQVKTGVIHRTGNGIGLFFVELGKATAALWNVILFVSSFMSAYIFIQDGRPTTIVLAAVLMLNSALVAYRNFYHR